MPVCVPTNRTKVFKKDPNLASPDEIKSMAAEIDRLRKYIAKVAIDVVYVVHEDDYDCSALYINGKIAGTSVNQPEDLITLIAGRRVTSLKFLEVTRDIEGAWPEDLVDVLPSKE